VNPLIIGIIILSILTKEWMARFSLYLGRTINSQILKADGEHHRSDALSSIVVLIGVLASYYGLPFLDGLVGMVLSVMIIYAGFKIARESASEILGKAPDEEELAAIVKTAKSVDGVRGVHDIIIHNYGSRKVISLHIEISNHLTITKAHAISEQVEQVLFDEMEYFATVHIDPLDFFDHQVKEVAHFLEEIRKEAPVKISGFHDIRILRSKHKDLYFDLSIEEHLNEPAKEQVRDFYKQKIHPRFPDIHGIFIQIEPLFTY
jgi:divalent metal cation (Fe/Co/Zn/Cd) transporter